MNTIPFLLMLLNSILSLQTAGYYTVDDFYRADKIDVHIHVETNRDAFVEQARKDNFRLLNIVVDLSKGPEWVEEQYDYCLDQKTRHPHDFEFATSFSIKHWDDPEWLQQTRDWLNKGIGEGAVAVKVWKNIGMVFRDKNGNQVMVDDPKLDIIFKWLASKGVPVIGHLGEPKNCWLPIEEMTTNNDKVYFEEHPQYHMYNHPDLPSYEEQIAARDRMLENNPDLIFIGAHVGSLEWSVDELAKRLDRFPNMSVDLAARMGQLFYQTQHEPDKVRAFFIKYQDRLLYATDMADSGSREVAELQNSMHKTWLRDWKFFVSDDAMTSDLISGDFRGLKLPKIIVDKLYSGNARKWLKMFPEDHK
ncbi:MAG: hypothetical protein DHS20C17_21280 [Cyclobacteriaceae bacterium]|nr:MAG: hypothetical protein DHS20C17_21280 [Cyclobacteriaceae bacterium]